MAIEPPSKADFDAFQSLSTFQDVASFFGTTRSRLRFDLYSSHAPQYRTFELKKANGRVRPIASPPDLIALYQRKLLSCITKLIKPKTPCHGFTIDRSIVTNANVHFKKRLILNIDLLDFFPSFHFGRVLGLFKSRPFDFNDNVAAVLAHLCCFDRKLPQGAPTSPIIANLICRGLDRDLWRLAQNHYCRYTRYADDITFSSQYREFDTNIVAEAPIGIFDQPKLGSALISLIEKHNLRINEEKTRLQRPNQRQEVTGLVVNQKVNVRREFIRNIRGIIHHCKTKGMDAAEQRFKQIDEKQRNGNSPSLEEHLKGKIQFVRMVKREDDPVFARYALRAQVTCARIFPKGVPIWGNSAVAENVEKATWVVLGKAVSGEQFPLGTAFTLLDVGIVSALHVFDPIQDGVKIKSWMLQSPVHPFKQFPILGIREVPEIDLTLLITLATNNSIAALKRSDDETAERGNVWIAGYPEWNNYGDKLLFAPATIEQTRTISMCDYIVTTANIKRGTSGGPILGERRTVIAVVLSDRNHLAYPNGGIRIRHLDDVKTARIRPL